MQTKKKMSLTKIIAVWSTAVVVGMAGFTIVIDAIGSIHSFNIHVTQMRNDYIANQKQMIKQEVLQVVDLINYERNRSEDIARTQLKLRVEQAITIARHLYEQNKETRNQAEIQKLVMDALRPIRYNQGRGYYFAIRMDGTEMLYPDKPELEGINLLKSTDVRVQTVCKDMIDIIQRDGEGFYQYLWSKPDTTGDEYKKIAFIKYFEPFNWFIGSGVYLAEVEGQIKQDILETTSRIRFGKEGYIFINRMNGDALISSGKLFSGDRKLWEVFDQNPETMKELFEKEYDAAMNPAGDYIYYNFMKLSNSEKPSPKASFIYGMPELNWLVGAGVYLDDVELDIANMETELHDQLGKKILLLALIPLGLIIVAIVLFPVFSRRLRNDTQLFLNFLKQAETAEEPIDRSLVHFLEADRLADHANRMLEEKILTRKELEREREALRQSEVKFRGLVESSSDWIWEVDAEGRYTYASPQVAAILGYAPEEIIGKTPFDLMPPEEAIRLRKQCQENMAAGRPLVNVENIATHKNGQQVILETSGVPILDSNDQVIGYRGVDRDISKRKRTEEELQRMQMLKSVGVLAGGIAHDFNNIMVGLFGNISLAKEELPDNHPAKKALTDAEKAMNRAIRLTKQLLTFSKGGSPVREQLDLKELIEEIIQFDLSGSNIKPVVQFPESACMINGDRGQLQQVFSNLIINAKQAMPNGGQLFTSLDITTIHKTSEINLKPGEYIQITFRDEGAGIDKQCIDKIFNPYFTTKQAGSGLGLATAYSIINKHDGAITVSSELGKGAVFTVYLPLVDVGQNRDTDDRQGESTGAEVSGKILIMDDEEVIRRVTQLLLTRAGYQVKTACSGEEAINMYEQAMRDEDPFDLVILDLTIPGGMGGKEAIKNILKIDPKARAIVSSGYADDPVMAHYAENGFIGVVAKPYSKEDILKALSDALEQEL